MNDIIKNLPVYEPSPIPPVEILWSLQDGDKMRAATPEETRRLNEWLKELD